MLGERRKKLSNIKGRDLASDQKICRLTNECSPKTQTNTLSSNAKPQLFQRHTDCLPDCFQNMYQNLSRVDITCIERYLMNSFGLFMEHIPLVLVTSTAPNNLNFDTPLNQVNRNMDVISMGRRGLAGSLIRIQNEYFLVLKNQRQHIARRSDRFCR